MADMESAIRPGSSDAWQMMSPIYVESSFSNDRCANHHELGMTQTLITQITETNLLYAGSLLTVVADSGKNQRRVMP